MASTNKARGDRLAIDSEMARRGTRGSGFALQNQIAAQQADSDRNAKSSLDVAGQAQDRALQSLIQAGQLGTQMRTQGFQEQSAKAQAQDAINKFNTGNLQDVQQRNIGTQNAAQATNLAAAQNLSNMNTNLSNEQQKYNNGLAQQQFENQAEIARGKNGVYQQQAQGALAQGQTQANLFSNLGNTGTGLAAGLGQQDMWTQYLDAIKNKNKTTQTG